MPRPATGSNANAGSVWWQLRADRRRAGGRTAAHRRAAGEHEDAVGGRRPERRRRARRAPGPGAASAGHGMTPASPRRGDVVPRVAELEQDLLGVLAVLGRPPQVGRPLVELHRDPGQPVAGAVVERDLAEVVVGDHLRVVEQLLDRLDRRPRRVDAAPAAPSTPRRCGRRTPRRAPRRSSAAFCAAGVVVGEARVVGQVGPADQLAERRPVAVGLEEHELDVAVVLRPVGGRPAG